MTHPYTRDIVAVVVTYQPTLEVLEQVIDALAPQVNSVLVVDNGSNVDSSAWHNQHQTHAVELILLGENKGIAAAHNVGIKWAQDRRVEFVLLMDQDSIPAPDMVFRLLFALRQLTKQGIKVAAVGPRYLDERNREHPSFIRVSGLKVDKSPCLPSEEIVESDFIISSGSLIPLATLAEVGGPLNDLFIDQVDLEWCFRARSRGYSLFGACNAILYHALGEAPKSLFGQKFIHHGPLRHYYIFRNAVWLLFKSYVSVGWKLLFIRTIFIRFLVYVCLVSPRLAYLKMMAKGVWHGLRGRMGKLETSNRGI